ncbi:MAG: hypothetical protein M1327_05100 [Candidatus Thermoplasmatota archaeon]|nr:hypothetical protein [Candidatus Thermoplasmatota archaeon]
MSKETHICRKSLINVSIDNGKRLGGWNNANKCDGNSYNDRCDDGEHDHSFTLSHHV